MASQQVIPLIEESSLADEFVAKELFASLPGLEGPAQGLEQLLSKAWRELSAGTQMNFRIIATGTPRRLSPAVQESILLVCWEALSNALRHSLAKEIEVELEYTSQHLRVVVRDNGVGIDPRVFALGPEYHWGLSQMGERTQKMSGKLRVLSNAGAGTEVELCVRGRIAFASYEDAPVLSLWWRFYPGRRQSQESSGLSA